MCGIAGIYSFSGMRKEDIQAAVRRMMHAISHRGPDGSGLWSGNQSPICFGHQRLAILDLSDAGAQPMLTPDGKRVIILNGEIYNYLEIRKDLEAAGFTFTGHSDTEVLLAAIQSWGIKEALNRSIGMFAVALWEIEGKKLFLARDRAGKKPLYYHLDSKRIIFASEIKALVSAGGISTSINEEAVYHYLSLGYIPAPHTIYNEIVEVKPGEFLTIDESLQINSERYWHYPVAASMPSLSLQEAVEATEKHLTDAIRIRLRSDVPVGTFLSGGIDSGLITGIAAGISSKPISTFTVGFDTDTVDESPLARLVAERYRTEHHEIRLSPDLDDLLPKVVAAYDEPFGDPSALPTFAVADAAGKMVKVVLNGEGSDELFGGYRRHQAIKYLSKIPEINERITLSILKSVHSLLPLPSKSRSRYAFFHRFMRGLFSDPATRYITWGSDGFTEIEKKHLFGMKNVDCQETPIYLEYQFPDLKQLDRFRHFLAMDFVSMMTDCLLVKMDIATMAHGLEARCPFLDQRLIEWSVGLSASTLMPGKMSKPILRELAKKYLPEPIVTAPKRGFEIPLVQWMEQRLINIVKDLCDDPGCIIRQIFDRKALNDIVDRRLGMDKERWAKRMWILMMLGLWDRQR